MGAWGEKAFENDSALDWFAELEAGDASLRSILSSVAETDEDEYLDVDDGSAAIAAAELVAAGLGKGRDRLTAEALAWIRANDAAVVADDMGLARRAVERVLAANSELCALWGESGADTPWHADVRELFARLGGDPDADDGGTAEVDAMGWETAKVVLLTFLRARGLEPNARQKARIEASRDPDEIRRWLARATDAPSIEAVLDE